MSNDPVTFSPAQPQNIDAIIVQLINLLNKKEKYIIEKRFALNDNANCRETLEKIGQSLGITRERVRQIENNAVKKLQRHSLHTHLKTLNQLGQELIKRHGGLMEEEKLVSQILKVIQNTFPHTNINFIRLALTLNADIKKIFNTILYRPHWKMEKMPHSLVQTISDKAIKVITRHKNVIPARDLAKKVQEKMGNPLATSELIISILETDKRIKFTADGVGLTIWRNINPRTLRDKITYILEKNKTPLHFVEIANKIMEIHFDHKKINVQAVHNELIRNEQFVLIGRGIYSLDTWGYEKGTVSEVIEKVLKSNKAKTMTQDEIVDAVLKQRQVKKITILLNLKNKPQFERMGRYAYSLAKA